MLCYWLSEVEYVTSDRSCQLIFTKTLPKVFTDHLKFTHNAVQLSPEDWIVQGLHKIKKICGINTDQSVVWLGHGYSQYVTLQQDGSMLL